VFNTSFDLVARVKE